MEVFEPVEAEERCKECLALARNAVAFEAALLLRFFSGTSSEPFLPDEADAVDSFLPGSSAPSVLSFAAGGDVGS